MKRKIINLIIEYYFRLRKLLGKNYTHRFFYSENQKETLRNFGWVHISTIKGKEYTEMKEFRHGWSNHPDAVLIGWGTIEDVVHNLEDRYIVGIDPYDPYKRSYVGIMLTDLQEFFDNHGI